MQEFITEDEGEGIAPEGEMVSVTTDPEGQLWPIEELGKMLHALQLVIGDVSGYARGAEVVGQDQGALAPLRTELQKGRQGDAESCKFLHLSLRRLDTVPQNPVMLRFLVVLRKQNLTRDVLDGEFGSKGDLALQVVNRLAWRRGFVVHVGSPAESAI